MTAPLWPWAPGAEIPETLAWSTDLLSAREDEQRLALALQPRRTLTYAHVFGDADRPALPSAFDAEALVRSIGAGAWRVPIWPEAQALAGPVGALDTSLPCDPDLADWEAGETVAIGELGARTLAATATIAAIEPGALTLTGPIGVDLTAPLLMPTRLGRLSAPLSGPRPGDGTWRAEASFTLEGGAFVAASPFPLLDGLEVMTDPAALVTAPAFEIHRPAEEFGPPAGPWTAEPLREQMRARATLALRDADPAARIARRRWLHARRGRQVAFRLPRPGAALRLAAPIGAGELVMTVLAPAEPEALLGRYLQIDDGGPLLLRRVSTVADLGAAARLGIAAPGRAIPASARITPLATVRLDADRIELRHRALGAGRAETLLSLPLIERPA